MKSYGKFEAVREICQTPVSAIWTARPAGTSGDGTASVKVIQPDAPVFAGSGAAAAEELLVSAALQQSIANKSEHWAPVYELGYDGKDAFYVGKLFDRSVQRLIDLRVKLNSADLLAITTGIVEGLNDLRSAFDRSHGNLKPANVLIVGRGKIGREDVRLTDPHAGDQELPSMTRSPDVKALGEIIFSLVTLRPHTAARWPVPESADWHRLGASGPQWLDLCNDLLNTMARQGPMALPKIQARLSAMPVGRARTPRSWIAVPAVILIAISGYAFRGRLDGLVPRAKQLMASLNQHPAPATSPATLPAIGPASRSTIALIPPDPKPTAVIAPVEPAPRTPEPRTPEPSSPTTVPSAPASLAVVPAMPPAAVPPPVVLPPVSPPPVVIPQTLEALPTVKLPAFLTGTAAAKFLDVVAQLSTTDRADQRAAFIKSVEALEAAYPALHLPGNRPWQKSLMKIADGKREVELTAAVNAIATASTPDPSKYNAFVSFARMFNTQAIEAEDAIDAGKSWMPESNRTNIETTLRDEQGLSEDSNLRNSAAPPELDEMRTIDDVVSEANPQALLVILHNQNASLPARVAAWQALDLPAMKGRWPAGRGEFVAGQNDGDALVAAAAGTNVDTKSAITDLQHRRFELFLATLTTPTLVTDAVTHITEIEGGRGDRRPAWLEFDRILYSLSEHPASPSEALLSQLKSLTTVPAASALYEALQRAKLAAANDQPLAGVGPGRLHWAARPFNISGMQGCIYSTDSCPPIEFIRVEPAKGLPFYLSTTEVPVGLIAALLADSTQSPASSTEALKALSPPSPTPGAHVWQFSVGRGIELDSDSYLQYFRQSPTPDLPMQQISPQAALYLARDLGCRLPTSAEWQAALSMATNPSTVEDAAKGFATNAWKLRDADFSSLVDKAALNQKYPDEGIFSGPDPSTIPVGAAATIWTPLAVHKLGGWTVADLRTDLQAKRQMARLDENSSDFRADLVDAAQVGFRPVGTTHHVFHDLVGNVGEFVLDAPVTDVESLPAGTKTGEKDITGFFASGDRIHMIGVIGGSFLSPPELDPMTRIALPGNVNNPAYADVGFRLAFTDPRAFADPSTVIRHTGYLYPQPTTRPDGP